MTEPLAVLRQLAEFQNLELAPDAEAVIEYLRPLLENYAELEFRSDARRLDLITLSRQPAEVERFLEVLAGRGFSADDLAVPYDLMQFGAGKTIGMKLPLAGPLDSGEVYLRGALLLDEAAYYLGKYGVAAAVIDHVQAVADVFEKPYLHMLAVDAGLPVQFSVFFTTYLDVDNQQQDRDLLARALELFGIESAAPYLNLHQLLSANRPETLYFSFGIRDGVVLPQVKVDYAHVRLGAVAEAVRAVGAGDQAPVLTAWGTCLGVSAANYAGVVLDAQGLHSARAYFTRRLPSLTSSA
jgi:hypothetical protein